MTIFNKFRKHSLKLVAFLSALAVWLFVVSSSKMKFEKIVPIEYLHSSQFVFSQKPITEVTFILEASRFLMNKIQEENLVLKIDLNNRPIGQRQSYQLQDEDMNFPFGVVINKILPRNLPIRLERKIQKSVPIKVSWTGELPEYLDIVSWRVKPESLDISGPRSLMSLTKSMMTNPIEKSTFLDQSVISAKLANLDERIEIKADQEFLVTAIIRANKSNQTLTGIRPEIVGGKQLKTDFQLKLWVENEQFDQWSEIKKEVKVLLILPDNVKGAVPLDPVVKLPRGVYLKEIFPKRIVVNLP